MSPLGSFIMGIVRVADFVLELYKWAVIASALFSWIRPDPRAPIVAFIYRITDPVVYWIRRTIPTVFGGIDLSAIILIFAIILVQKYVFGILINIALRL